MIELEPGLRYWYAPHPAWGPDENWPEGVLCAYYEAPDALLVAPPLGHDLVSPLPLQVTPLADEDRRDVELLGNDAKVPTQRETDLLDRVRALGNRVERGMESGGAVAHRLVQQVLLRVDVRVERALLHAHGLGEVADRRPVVAALREEPRGRASQLRATS